MYANRADLGENTTSERPSERKQDAGLFTKRGARVREARADRSGAEQRCGIVERDARGYEGNERSEGAERGSARDEQNRAERLLSSSGAS